MRPSRWLIPCGLFAVLYFAASIVPEAIERLYVGPNQITLEQPYLLRSIAGTREAYNLDGASMQEREYAVSAAPLTREDLDKSGATLQDARIWDWRALEPQLQQTQGLRPYYSFAGVDIDRYMIDGAERQVMITARELNVEKLPDQAKVWVNLALKYTHGYGAVAVPANEVDSRGNPVLWAHDIPLIAKGDLAVKQGAIYYGKLTRDRVYVRTSEKEFDFPTGRRMPRRCTRARAAFRCPISGASSSCRTRPMDCGSSSPNISRRKAGCCCAGISSNASKGSRRS